MVPRLSDGASRPPSAGKRLALGALGAVAWLGLALVALAVKLVLLPRRRSAGAAAVVWGVLFAAYIWWGSHQIGLRQWKAILLGAVAGVATALFIYLRGASLERPPADRAGAFVGRFLGTRRRATPK